MKQLQKINLEDIAFVDIETVRAVDELDLDSPLGESWEYKMRYSSEAFDGELPEVFKQKAALFAEFAKVVCITIGRVNKEGTKIKLKTYVSDDEEQLLRDFTADLNLVTASKPKTVLCGHAIIGFDIPFLFRRCLIHGIVPNDLIDVGGLKPWEVSHLDTMIMWKGTGFNNASLMNICVAMGLPSPKTDINGADVSNVFYNEGVAGLQRIAAYCEGDVIAVINILLKMCFKNAITDLRNIERPVTMEVIPEPLVTRIMGSGITPAIEKEILAKVKKFTKEEKRLAVEVINGALSLGLNTLTPELEAKILK